ncbi:MAG: hypothetical protein IK031_00050 [Bacteroidales bacterium]|nr:hypothetical protein [Bacteroidales bacterium]
MKEGLKLSICIPTDGTVRWVLPALEAIYSQDCDPGCFEVVITDNGPSDELEKAIAGLDYPNLTYRRTESKGFLNIVDSLKLGRGLLCKVLNHRDVLIPGTIRHWLDLTEKYMDEKPVIYCTSGELKEGTIIECGDFDTFVARMSYWSSWMAGLCVWDIDKPALESIQYDKMFPNTSLLFEMRQESRYVIDDIPFATHPNDRGKGGYNIFRTFAVGYLDILNDLRRKGRISLDTFVKVKGELYGWLTDLYYKEVFSKSGHTYDLSDIDKSMEVYFTKAEYRRMKRMAPWLFVKRRWIKYWGIVGKLFRKK